MSACHDVKKFDLLPPHIGQLPRIVVDDSIAPCGGTRPGNSRRARRKATRGVAGLDVDKRQEEKRFGDVHFWPGCVLIVLVRLPFCECFLYNICLRPAMEEPGRVKIPHPPATADGIPR